MSFFSISSGRRPYRDPYRGGSHYQRKGLFGKLGSLMGSFSSGRRGCYPPNQYPYQNQPPQQQPPAGANVIHSSNFCPGCGANVPNGSKFCLECGAPMQANPVCTGCGQPLPANAKFCPGCGTPRR